MIRKTNVVPGALLAVMAAALMLSASPMRETRLSDLVRGDTVTAVIAEARALGVWRSGPRALVAAPVSPQDLAGYGLSATTFDAAELPLSLVLLKGDFAPGRRLPSARVVEARYMVVVYSLSQRRPVLVSLSADGARYRPLFAAAGLAP